jgi:phosphate-selective porin OprO/OprP
MIQERLLKMRYSQLLYGLLLVVGVGFLPARAQTPDQTSTQQEIQELKRRLAELEARVNAQNAAAQQAPAGPQSSRAAGAQQSQNAATPQVENLIPTPDNLAGVTADTTGFRIRSNDGNFSLKIGADLQVDTRSFVGDGDAGTTDQILLRRVRPTFSGTVYKDIDYFFRPDFGQGTVVLYEAYTQFNYFKHVNLRVGKFKPPVGLERLQSDDDTSFIERGLPTLLVPSRDIGFQLAGDIVKQRVGYQVGVFNGVPDNGLSDTSPSSHRDYAGRLFLTPFLPDQNKYLQGLGFGLAATGGNVDGIALPSYKTFGQNSFLTFASGVTSAGHRTRLAPQGYYYAGPFGLYAEYGLNEEEFQKSNVRRDIAFRAWQVQASYILTGEKKGFLSPTPNHNFDPLNHGWGAWEVAIRTGDFSIDRGLFNYGFASTSTSPRNDREYVAGVNWYLNRLVRISFDYGHSGFGGGAPGGLNKLPEQVIILRFQLNFI